MFETIKEGFKQFTFLNPKDLIELATIIKIKHVKKGDHLLKVGDYNYNAVIVVKGLLCHYLINENGTEKILLFAPEKKNSGSLKTIMLGESADENIVALENSILICADSRDLDKLAKRNIRVSNMLNKSYKNIIVEAALRIKFLIAFTPQERYTFFCETYPNLEGRIKQKHLASYLGITNTSLSRMKAKLKES